MLIFTNSLTGVYMYVLKLVADSNITHADLLTFLSQSSLRHHGLNDYYYYYYLLIYKVLSYTRITMLVHIQKGHNIMNKHSYYSVAHL